MFDFTVCEQQNFAFFWVITWRKEVPKKKEKSAPGQCIGLPVYQYAP